jgi:hypothetical protein
LSFTKSALPIPRASARLVAVVFVVLAAGASAAAMASGSPARSARVPVAFRASSPWNTAIPAHPALDPRSSQIGAYLGSEMRAFADLYESGTPVWEASGRGPRDHVGCTERWGRCELSQQPIQIPSDASPAPGSDGSMVVINGRKGYDFWRARKTSLTGWTAAWGTRFNLAGRGTGNGATGAGVPLLAGLPRLAEMERGQIEHALDFVTSNTCASVYRYPASKTDGRSEDSECIPEGARIQLDPSINVNAIPGISPGEKIVAHALAVYGAYCKDTGGARLAFGFEDPVGKPNPYPALGFHWDYYDMSHIPWNHLRVLRQWNGG